METYPLMVAAPVLAVGGLLFWRYVWFFRNPVRTPPLAEGILSPADGTVVYVKTVQPFEEVAVIKKGVKATVRDILREDDPSSKLVIGVFMSPFNVHYNRVPLSGQVEFIRHYPAMGKNVHMGPMHWRTLLNRPPHYVNSLHIVQNERKVTLIRGLFKGRALACYIVQIAAKSVNGIDSYVGEGNTVKRGEIFGMIRIGSQVDLIVPWYEDLRPRVKVGDKVRAGETILID
jgi:phosphatidylserine decarboxylase